MLRIGLADEVTVFIEPGDDVLLSRFEDNAAPLGELGIAQFERHIPRGQKSCEVKAAQPCHRAIPIGVERVMLVAFDETIPIAILGDEPLDGLFEPRPVAFEEGIVGGHLVLAQDAENEPGLGIDGRYVITLAPEMDGAIRLERQTEIDLLARDALQLREEARHSMAVVPHVTAGPFAAADALPAIETAITKPVAGRGRQDRSVEESAVQEPIRQRRVIPGVVPEARLAAQAGEMLPDVLSDHVRRCEARRV